MENIGHNLTEILYSSGRTISQMEWSQCEEGFNC